MFGGGSDTGDDGGNCGASAVGGVGFDVGDGAWGVDGDDDGDERVVVGSDGAVCTNGRRGGGAVMAIGVAVTTGWPWLTGGDGAGDTGCGCVTGG